MQSEQDLKTTEMAMKWNKMRILPHEKDDSTIYDLGGGEKQR